MGPMTRDDSSSAGSLLRAIAEVPAQTPPVEDRVPAQLAQFRIIERLGRGGMGVVYRAMDEKLKRHVALKVLPEGFAADEDRRKRFVREAQSAAAVLHPNVATIFEVGESEGRIFIAMELVEGAPLRASLKAGPLTPKATIEIGKQIARGLARAHERGIVHRDLKPENVMITPDGVVKIVDFGLAKLRGVPAAAPSESVLERLETASVTEERHVVGTPAYMSPEQVSGVEVDAPSDVFSLGIVLYEMLTGTRPFPGNTPPEVAIAQRRAPHELRSRRASGVSSALDGVIDRCLAKDPSSRPTAREVSATLDALGTPLARNRRVLALALIAVLLALGIPLGLLAHRVERTRWAREEAVPEVERLLEQEKYVEAFRLATEAKKHIPTDPVWKRLDPNLSHPISIETTPPGATVSYREYGAGEDQWTRLGQAPLTDVQVPNAFLEWRIDKSGFASATDLSPGVRVSGTCEASVMRFLLHAPGDVPEGMVYVSAGHEPSGLSDPELDELPATTLHDFWIDRYEVTNRQYKRFVDAGGYRDAAFWREPFVDGNEMLTFDLAIARFTDATGRPGPATWEAGRYPEGQDDLPVTGVSWYEAAAYAVWAGKSLPTIYHWYRVAEPSYGGFVVPRSNFAGHGAMRVGASGGLNRWGAFDMAGNVKEWCLNRADADKRYILGGAWDEPPYMFNDFDARAAFHRSANFGFRCVKYSPDETLTVSGAIVLHTLRDYSKETPVGDETFEAFRRAYDYDRADPAARVDSVDDSSPDWRRETVSFAAAYGGERIAAFVYLPRGGTPPYETVVYFPGSSAFGWPSISTYPTRSFDWIVKSGRAVVFPVYKSTFERHDDASATTPLATTLYREHVIEWAKDVRRAVDYLQTRPDVARDRLAYMGVSWGAELAPIFLSLEPRLKAALLIVGGFEMQRPAPDVDPFNFAPRAKVPTLLLNGRFDFDFKTDSQQVPFFRLLGTPDSRKRRVVYDTGHNIPRTELVRETLDWLDRYLGPVP